MKKKSRLSIPGVEGSTLELLVSGGERVQLIPNGYFVILLLGLAVLAGWGAWPVFGWIWGFFLLDWVLIAALPRLKISYGPAKPPTVLLAIMRIPFLLFPSPLRWAFQVIGTVLVLYGFWIEPQRLVVSKEYLRIKVQGSGETIHILHIGDLHVERVTTRERKVIEAARKLRPDLILFSGDILSYSNVDDPIAWNEARSIFSELTIIARVIAVAGSPPVDRKDILEFVYGESDVILLDSGRVKIDHPRGSITLTGIPCTHLPNQDGENLSRLDPPETEALNILLYHSPDLAPKASAIGYDLQLSGHTHGGQVRLPLFGALYTSSLFGKRYESGRYKVGEMTLFVTRGLGMEGRAAPRVRFLCPPEIVLWEIATVPDISPQAR